MNVFAQLGSSSILLLLIAAVIYIFGPASNCDRAANASNVVYLTAGILPKIGELATGRSLDKYWADVDDVSIASHKWIVEYFKFTACSEPKFTFYKKNEKTNSDAWLKKYDPELKKLGEKAGAN